MRRRGGKVLKPWFTSLLFVGFIVLLVLGLLPSEGIKETTSRRASLKYLEVTERGKHGASVRRDLDPNYMSKRRVPRGPDPIHNRRAGNSKRPHGHA